MSSSWKRFRVTPDVAVLILSVLVGMGLSLLHGQSNSWDLLNYHLSNPWAAVHHRWSRDVFVAGPHSYFDPILGFPYYFLAFDWLRNEPWLVTALAGIPFGCLGFVTFVFSRNVFRRFAFLGAAERTLYALLATVLGVSAAAAWSQAFSTSNEVTLAVLVLISLNLLVSGRIRSNGWQPLTAWRAVIIGLVLGLAAGLKLTAGIYAPAMGVAILVAGRNPRHALGTAALYSLGWFVAFLLVFGPWGWHLYATTGDPLFPMFNNFFHSPYAAAIGGRDTHSLPHTVAQWVAYPYFWLDYGRMTVLPLHFRDARIAGAFTALLVVGLVGPIRHRWLRDRRPTLRSAKMFAVLAAFFLTAYAVWLVLFSLLRYGIVLEILASITVVAATVWLLTCSRVRGVVVARALVACGLVPGLMLFARIPDFGSVPIGHATFSWRLPRLAKSPLVILANQGMGLLAPMIWEDQPGATFVGIPRCFGKNGWCYRQFYHYRLGSLIRRKVADHTGPLYVAYYVTKNPSLPQLGLFGVAMNRADCQLMHTNRTPDVAICSAVHRAVGRLSEKGAPKYRLALHAQGGRPGTKLEADWHDNPCSRSSGRAVLEVRWMFPKAVKMAKVFVSSPPNYTRSLFASGGRVGKAVTGNWVQAGQRFTFTNGGGKVLMTATVRYQKCKSRSALRDSGHIVEKYTGAENPS